VAQRGRPKIPENRFKREHVIELIHDEAFRMRQERVPIYKVSARDRSLTTDFYTAKNGIEIMAVTSHGLDALWRPNSMILGGRYSNQSHTGIFSSSSFDFLKFILIIK
jgi:hypothetical protein